MRIFVKFALNTFLKNKKIFQGLIKSKYWCCSWHLNHQFQGFISNSKFYWGFSLSSPSARHL